MGGYANVQRIDGLQINQFGEALPVAVAVAVDRLGEVVHAVDVQLYRENRTQPANRFGIGAALARFFSLGSQIDREMSLFSDEFQVETEPARAASFGRHESDLNPYHWMHRVGDCRTQTVSVSPWSLNMLLPAESQWVMHPKSSQTAVGWQFEMSATDRAQLDSCREFVWVRPKSADVNSIKPIDEVLTRLPCIGDSIESDFVQEKEECLDRIERLEDLVGVFRRFHIVISQISKRIEIIESMVDRIIGRSSARSESDPIQHGRSKALIAIESIVQISGDPGLVDKLFGKSINIENEGVNIAKLLHQFSALESNISQLKLVISLIKTVESHDIVNLTSSASDQMSNWFDTQFSAEAVERFVSEIQSNMTDLVSHVKQFDRESEKVFPNGSFTSTFFKNLRSEIRQQVSSESPSFNHYKHG